MHDYDEIHAERRREIVGIVVILITIIIFLALVTDGYESDVRRPIDGMSEVPNVLGGAGAALAGILTLIFGGAAHALYVITGVWGGMLLANRPLDRLGARIIGALVLLASVSALLHVDMSLAHEGDPVGGIVGAFAGSLVDGYFGLIGANIIAGMLAIVGLLLSTEFLFIRIVNNMRVFAVWALRTAWNALLRGSDMLTARRERVEADLRGRPRVRKTEPDSVPDINDLLDEDVPVVDELPFDITPVLTTSGYDDDVPEPPRIVRFRKGRSVFVPAPPKESPPRSDEEIEDLEEAVADEEDLISVAAAEERPEAVVAFDDTEASPVAETVAPLQFNALKPKPRQAAMPRRKVDVQEELPADYVYPKKYTRPPIDLFDPPTPPKVSDRTQELVRTSAMLEECLQTFGIEAKVTDVTRGPTITRFELEPAPGIKVSRFLSLADDIALALKAHRVRVEAPIPGKGRVGIEVPNKDREAVVVRELLETRVFCKSKGILNLALGKDIAGDVMVADMTAMPHLLVAGATGAGKTVCVKTLLASLLYRRSPDELQMMLIDPKMVELSIFNDIPHLITPVVTDPKKAASALNWLIVEMEERYRLFAHLRVRNIEVYNQSVDNGEIEMVNPDGKDDEAGESVAAIRKLPYIVCVIDELADLMMLARAEVEDAIARLAQLARAVGIHLIIATQRPSVDVLTGVIKANFPCRISFQVSSRVDSRCILDEIGAERLIGKGDMLYLPAGQSKPTRIQGAFVCDDEMNRLIAYLKTQAPPQYRDEIANFGKSKDSIEDLVDQDDELFDEAIRVVLETGQASISMVQRRLRVGYTRAARLIDM
ncbi:MAG: DNA translocase FtsK, partial [Candidatus Hydrogenedentales bacterium]